MSPQLKKRYAIIILTVFTVIIVTGIGNFREKQLAVNLVGSRVTQAVALAVEGLDVVQVQQLIQTRDERDPSYALLRKDLIALRKAQQLENIYMLYKDEKEVQWFYVVDAREESDPAHTPLGKIENRVTAAVEKTIRGKTVQAEYHETSFGPCVSSYQEIKDSQGKTFAVVGADFKVAEMKDFLAVTRYAQMGLMALALLLIGWIALK